MGKGDEYVRASDDSNDQAFFDEENKISSQQASARIECAPGTTFAASLGINIRI